MNRFGRGPVLVAVGVPLATVGSVLLWDGWTGRFVCPLCVGVGCAVVGAVWFFFTALTHAASRDSSEGERPA
ncbi:hypothetical protein J0H58_33880 [bacterium]|nr:hypothetical protein [bacterium]